MELMHTRTQKRLQQHADAADKVDNVTGSPVMKQVIFWILIILAFICVISLGAIIVNYSLNTRV